MSLLKINIPDAPVPNESLQPAGNQVKKLFFPMGYFDGKSCRAWLHKFCADLPLSTFFTIVFPVLFDVIKGKGAPRGKKLDLIGSFALNAWLRNDRKFAMANEARLSQIKFERYQLVNCSYAFIFFGDIYAQDAKLNQEEQELKRPRSFSTYYLLVEILVILEEIQSLTRESGLFLQAELINNPWLFIRNLAPLLCFFQKLDHGLKEGCYTDDMVLVIDETLKYLGYKEGRPALALQIIERLIEKKYLEELEEACLVVVPDEDFIQEGADGIVSLEDEEPQAATINP